jgi:hypothetical protein
MMSLEVTPDDLDIIEFGRIFRQPLYGEPLGQAKMRSTTHSRGNSSKPSMSGGRSTIFDVHDQGPQFVKAIANLCRISTLNCQTNRLGQRVCGFSQGWIVERTITWHNRRRR